ncbi:MAG TPA: DUF4012 domain-containing protein [Actinomycetota bacterium]
MTADFTFKPARSRRVARVATISLLVVLVAFLADLVYAAVGLNTSLNGMKDALEDGRRQLRDGAVEGSLVSFRTAVEKAEQAAGFATQPAWSVLTSLPLIGRDGRAVEAMSEAGGLTARAGEEAVRAGDVLGVDRDGLANSIYREGTVRFGSLDAGAPYVARATDLLTRADDILSDSPAPSLGLVEQRLADARLAVSSAATSATKAEALLDALPNLLGRTKPRTYLLGFQALSEARGTGGVIGMYGLLDADSGRIRLRKVDSYVNLFPSKFPAVPAPHWFEKSYADQLGLKQWPQANLSPNFPVVSRVMLNMYEAQTGKRLDGVFALDPVALAHLLRGIGPLSVPQLDEPITSANVERILMRDSYLDFADPEEQNVFLRHVVQHFWNKVSRGNLDGPKFVAGLGEAVRTQHVKIYSRVNEDQRALSDLGVDGSYARFGPNIQMVYGNSNLASKVDYYLSRSIETTIQVNESGSARARTTITLDNDAPKGPPSLLLGPVTQEHAPGLNRSLLHFLLPEGARVNEFLVDGRAKARFKLREQDHPVVWNVVDVPAGKSAEATIDYTFSLGSTISPDDGGELDFTLFPQTTLTPDTYSITVVPPPGYVGSGDGLEASENGYLRAKGTLEEPVRFSIVFDGA